MCKKNADTEEHVLIPFYFIESGTAWLGTFVILRDAFRMNANFHFAVSTSIEYIGSALTVARCDLLHTLTAMWRVSLCFTVTAPLFHFVSSD